MDYWFYNTSKRDVILSDINVVIRSKKYCNLLKYNRNLTPQQVEVSLAGGSLLKRIKQGLIVQAEPPLPVPPKKLLVSNKPIYSRSLSVVLVDPKDKHFVDHLINEFDGGMALDEAVQVARTDKLIKNVDLDGFFDPLEGLDEPEKKD